MNVDRLEETEGPVGSSGPGSLRPSGPIDLLDEAASPRDGRIGPGELTDWQQAHHTKGLL
jgi:hypothetical protein